MHIEIERQINLGLHPVHVHVRVCTGRERRACRFDRREASTGRRRRRRPAPSAVPVDPTVSHAASLPPCKHRYLQHTKLQEEEKSPISAPRASSTSYWGTNDKTERKRSQSERSLCIFALSDWDFLGLLHLRHLFIDTTNEFPFFLCVSRKERCKPLRGFSSLSASPFSAHPFHFFLSLSFLCLLLSFLALSVPFPLLSVWQRVHESAVMGIREGLRLPSCLSVR